MALETSTYISGLVATNPTATDSINNADDHLRLIKSSLKATFPNFTGAAVTLSEANINALDTRLSAVEGTYLTTGTLSSNLQALYPVGIVVRHTSAAFDPATAYGFGTWTQRIVNQTYTAVVNGNNVTANIYAWERTA